ELARAIVQALTPTLVPRAALVQQSTSSTEAHDLYLRGRFFWNQRSKESLAKATALFEQAIALDQKYALAYAGLADCYVFAMTFASARAGEALPKAKALALKSVDLDDSLAEAHASLGLVHEREYEWKAAEREYRRAIELRPGYATAHQWYAGLLRTLARRAEEHAEMERARQLDPTSVIINSNIAAMYYNDRDYERAVVQATKTLELDPGSNLPVLPLVMAYKAMGKY